MICWQKQNKQNQKKIKIIIFILPLLFWWHTCDTKLVYEVRFLVSTIMYYCIFWVCQMYHCILAVHCIIYCTYIQCTIIYYAYIVRTIYLSLGCIWALWNMWWIHGVDTFMPYIYCECVAKTWYWIWCWIWSICVEYVT